MASRHGKDLLFLMLLTSALLCYGRFAQKDSYNRAGLGHKTIRHSCVFMTKDPTSDFESDFKRGNINSFQHDSLFQLSDPSV